MIFSVQLRHPLISSLSHRVPSFALQSWKHQPLSSLSRFRVPLILNVGLSQRRLVHPSRVRTGPYHLQSPVPGMVVLRSPLSQTIFQPQDRVAYGSTFRNSGMVAKKGPLLSQNKSLDDSLSSFHLRSVKITMPISRINKRHQQPHRTKSSSRRQISLFGFTFVPPCAADEQHYKLA